MSVQSNSRVQPTRYDADERGYFGETWGGRFMPEALVAALDELTDAWHEAMADAGLRRRASSGCCATTPARPSRLYHAERLSDLVGARVLLKREDLNHTGAHKIRNVLGQALLTKRMGKTRVIAETGAGQHGVASATAAAWFDLDCTVYMGAVDTRRQALNVARMQLLGAKVVPVESGSATLKDAINEALRDWVASVDHTAYLFGTAAGPHPFPSMVRDFCRGIGDEARAQCLEQYGVLPDAVAACVGGGSNAIGLFTAFLDDEGVEIHGFEPGGDGVETGRHAATIHAGEAGVLHGARTYVLQDEDGQTIESHSISAGLDYPGVGPQHAHLAAAGRATYTPGHGRPGDGRDGAAEPHRGHHPGDRVAPTRSPVRSTSPSGSARRRAPTRRCIINLSGRGDKDMGTAIEWFGLGDAERPTPTRAVEADVESDAHGGAAVTSSSTAFETRPGRGARRPGRLPAGRLPERRRLDRGHADHGRGRLRRHRDRPALQRPGDGRAHDPGRRPGRARRRGPHRDVMRVVEAVAATGVPDPGHDLLEPGRALRRRAVRRRPGRGRGRRPDHARHHPRPRRASGSPPPTRTTSTRSSSSRPARPTSASR